MPLIARTISIAFALAMASQTAEARGSSGGNLVGGVFGFLVIGIISYAIFRLACGEKNWWALPRDLEEWIGLVFVGALAFIIGLYLWLFGFIMWGTYNNRLPLVTTILGGAIFGTIAFFILRTLTRIIVAARTRNRRSEQSDGPRG